MATPPTEQPQAAYEAMSSQAGAVAGQKVEQPTEHAEQPSAGSLNAPSNFVPDWVPRANTFRPQLEEPVAVPTAVPVIQTEAPVLLTEPQPPEPKPSSLASVAEAAAEDEEQEDERLIVQDLVSAAPPWLVSLVLHLLLLVVLALILLPKLSGNQIELSFNFSEKLGEQLEEETFSISDAEIADTFIDTTAVPDDVDDPLASPNTDLMEMPEQLIATADFSTPNIGLALTGREEGMRETLLLAYGGDDSTEQAVRMALEWLKKQQRKDGSWRMDGPYSDGASLKNPLAATSMALLAFQGAGFTHKSTRKMVDGSGNTQRVDYRKVVERAWKKMLSWQEDNGRFYRKAGMTGGAYHNQRLYSQAQATIAICELYGMTRDPKYRRPAQRAVNFAVSIQDDDGEFPDGGWRYEEGYDSDMSVTGWYVMALQSARMAGLDVPSDTFHKIEEFLDAVSEDGSFYSYQVRRAPKPSMTAEGLLCRQYLGWKQADPRMRRGIDYLKTHPVDWDEPNTYYWYYATQVMHHMEGDDWFEWNRVMKKQVTRQQVRTGREAGSWPITDDQWAGGGGRLYQTCMCTFMLEVYYRHLPIYAGL